MMIGGETYGSLTPDKAKRILRGIREKEAAGQ
jgi:NADH:ubiquinone oxidoreductase subunit E